MPTVKEPANITLAQGLTLLESHLPTEEAKTRLRQALGQGVLNESPRFALDYHEADIDWATGAVKLPRMKKPFFPTFLRSDIDRNFFKDHVVQPSASYSRETVICAADMLKALGHSGFDRFLMELNLPDQSVGRGSGLMARATSLAQYAIDNPLQPTPERRTVAYEIIRRAAQLWGEGVTSNLGAGEREKFLSAMQREGQAHMLSDEQDNLALWRPETGNSRAAPLMALTEPTPDKSPAASDGAVTTKSEKTQGELLTLKPTLWGLSIDLKELWRRTWCWWKQRQ